MELIKRIKEAETEAQEIIAQGRAAASEQAEEGRRNRLEAQGDAEEERKKSIEASVSAAESDARVEVDALKAQAEGQRRQLRDSVGSKMAASAGKVVDYLRG